MNKTQDSVEFVSRRFNRDASAFEAIYQADKNGFDKWFNRKFRKPIYERFEIAINAIGDAKGKKILDIGCGTGIYMVTLASKGASRVLGIDFSESMLAFARQKIQSSGLEKNCELRQADFLETNLNEKFDYSLAMGVFDYLPDPVTFLRKLKSVTSYMVIASLPGYSPIRGPLRQLRYLLTKRGNVYFYSKSDIEKILFKAGFSDYELIPGKTGKGFVLLAKVT